MKHAHISGDEITRLIESLKLEMEYHKLILSNLVRKWLERQPEPSDVGLTKQENDILTRIDNEVETESVAKATCPAWVLRSHPDTKAEDWEPIEEGWVYRTPEPTKETES